MNNRNHNAAKHHLLTVMLEDYFHVGALNGPIQREQWYRFQTRLERNTLKALELLDRFNIKATFFVSEWVADKQPEIVREVARCGHELASRGLYHRRKRTMTPKEFREDLARSRSALERASGTKVLGYRAARLWSNPSELWKLDIVAEEGYAYDSSLIPLARSFKAEPARRFTHQHRFGEKQIWEFPISSCNILSWLLPIAGGNYFRQLPHTLLKHMVEHWHRTYDAPFVMYTHVWELDPEQPRISGVSHLARIRHYRNLDKMAWVLEDYFKKYNFVGMADYLGLDATVPTAASVIERELYIDSRAEQRQPIKPILAKPAMHEGNLDPLVRTPVSIVVPCYNEELILPYLANTLKSVTAAFQNDYELRFVFVDDGSSDGTFESLGRLFGSWPNCRVVRHTRNLGVAAAILNGIRHADTEIVCSIDCDCTYDPHHLLEMILRLTEGVDMVTASPYHPQGGVRNVPKWRLSLSKSASFLYRQTLRQKLCTYTSCFRVYRRSAVVDLRLRESGFLGVTEILGRLDLRGSTIVEHPAMLEVRLFGQSKMKVLKTIAGHLKLIARLSMMRMRHNNAAARNQPLKQNPTPDASLEFGKPPTRTVPQE